MDKLNEILHELGISKVKLAKYLGVSRQMVYNYLELDSLKEWPKEKRIKLFDLLDIKEAEDLDNIRINSDYMLSVENTLKNEVRNDYMNEETLDLKELKKRDRIVLTDIFFLLKEMLQEGENETNVAKKDVPYYTAKYLYHFLQSIDQVEELRYLLGYISKSTGFIDPEEFKFNEDKQYIFEGVMFAAMTLYNGGSASKTRIGESRKRFIADIKHKNEEKLSRTQELNTAKVQALKELNYTEINENNAAEVLEKIAEIQSRKV